MGTQKNTRSFIMRKVSSRLSSLCSTPLIKLMAFLTCLVLSQPVFAQQAIAKMNSVADNILEILTGNLVRAILAISLCCCAVAYATNRDNDKVKRGALAVGIASVIIISASEIVKFLMTS
jgi:type IV secretory pathway VirB2 component (pilin)